MASTLPTNPSQENQTLKMLWFVTLRRDTASQKSKNFLKSITIQQKVKRRFKCFGLFKRPLANRKLNLNEVTVFVQELLEGSGANLGYCLNQIIALSPLSPKKDFIHKTGLPNFYYSQKISEKSQHQLLKKLQYSRRSSKFEEFSSRI